ncbi:MAG: hypothetical protein HC800_18640 [Phormidesmis sp. RL_2_1]|nr:hypothetical protein [Phormidesmis sp. RL_2_1]
MTASRTVGQPFGQCGGARSDGRQLWGRFCKRAMTLMGDLSNGQITFIQG